MLSVVSSPHLRKLVVSRYGWLLCLGGACCVCLAAVTVVIVVSVLCLRLLFFFFFLFVTKLYHIEFRMLENDSK